MMTKKIGNFELSKYDFYGDVWASKSPLENIRKDSPAYCSLEKDSVGTWTISIMSGIWCENCYYNFIGGFHDCVKHARKYLEKNPL